MRRLIYVPIIHAGPDLGTLAAGIEERATAVVSSSNWQKHKEVVRLYWQAIADYWEEENISGFKIFQDGMPVGGSNGKNIVKDLAAQGSINYMIVDRLLEKGAVLVRTEDPDLLKKEYLLTSALMKSKTFFGSLLALLRYRWRKNGLLKARDIHIIQSINTGLGEEETGICLLGANHQVLPCLPKDIDVATLKDPEKVRAYSQKYTLKKWEDEVNVLGSYLTAPIKITPGEAHE